MEIDPSFAARGVRHIAHGAVASTNALALAYARAGRAGPLWVTAERQTAGRGRRGRCWESPPGNLYATLLLTAPCRPERAPQLSFVAALAVHDAVLLSALAAPERLRLKWPNDLLLDGAKLAGILVEGETSAEGAFSAAVGIGVNCVSHPAAASYAATDLRQAGLAVDVAALFGRLADAMQARLAQWRGGEGFAATRSDWLLRTARIGDAIRVRSRDEVEGAFAGIDEDGRLLLSLANGGVQAFAAADTSFVPAAAGPGRT